jgi:arabinogalactan endo-1,4-beta-galactosidase
MSLYPSTSDWSAKVSQCKTNMADMKSRYGKWCVLCEIGIAANSGSTGASFVKAARALCNDVFYWEPEAYNWQGYGLGAWDYSTLKPTVILTTGLKYGKVQDNIAIGQENKATISVFPNPLSSNILYVDLGKASGKSVVNVLNTSGQVMATRVVTNQSLLSIDNLNLKPGVYFVQIDNELEKVVKTLVVK